MSVVLIDVLHGVVAVALLFGPLIAVTLAERPHGRRAEVPFQP